MEPMIGPNRGISVTRPPGRGTIHAVAIRSRISREELLLFLRDYALGALESFSGIERGTVNTSYALHLSGGPVFLRIYEEQGAPRAAAEAEMLAHLSRGGVKTPGPLARTDGGFVGELAGKPAALFPWCDGEMRCLRAVRPADGEKVGEALARVHAVGAALPRQAGRFEPADLLLRLDRIAGAPDAAIAAEAEPLRRKLATWDARRRRDLPRGLIHGDLFRDNVLWLQPRDGPSEISALLDFESASDGTLAYDLMVTVLAWSFRDTLEAAIARAIVAGYESVRQLSDSEREGLLAEGALAAIRFTVTRLTDDALRALETGRPRRPDKDYRRFLARLAWLEAHDVPALRRLLWA